MHNRFIHSKDTHLLFSFLLFWSHLGLKGLSSAKWCQNISLTELLGLPLKS